MTVDKGEHWSGDSRRVNLDRDSELEYWSGCFGVSRDELKQISAQVGPMVKDIERALQGSAGV